MPQRIRTGIAPNTTSVISQPETKAKTRPAIKEDIEIITIALVSETAPLKAKVSIANLAPSSFWL